MLFIGWLSKEVPCSSGSWSNCSWIAFDRQANGSHEKLHDHCSILILCFAMPAMPRSKKFWEIFVQGLLVGLVRSMCSNPRDPLWHVHPCALPFCGPLVSLSHGFCQRRPSRSSKVQLMLVFAWIYVLFISLHHVSHAGLKFSFSVREK